MEVMTDNNNRTVAEIRHLMNKYGGNLGENGSVSWMFEKLGQIIIESNLIDEEKLLSDVLEVGAEDFSKDGSDFLITSKSSLTADIAEKLEHKGYNILSSKIEMVPKNIVEVNDSNSSKLITLMEQLEDHDDVQNIASNFQIIYLNTNS